MAFSSACFPEVQTSPTNHTHSWPLLALKPPLLSCNRFPQLNLIDFEFINTCKHGFKTQNLLFGYTWAIASRECLQLRSASLNCSIHQPIWLTNDDIHGTDETQNEGQDVRAIRKLVWLYLNLASVVLFPHYQNTVFWSHLEVISLIFLPAAHAEQWLTTRCWCQCPVVTMIHKPTENFQHYHINRDTETCPFHPPPAHLAAPTMTPFILPAPRYYCSVPSSVNRISKNQV